MMVEMGTDRIHHGFWRFSDPEHRLYEPGSRYEHVIRDYYVYLDSEIGRLVDEPLNRGQYSVNFDASQLASGVYIYELRAAHQVLRKKMMLVK